ncbi:MULTISPECIES: TRAP transporter substrate-binding protein [Anaerotruncus]|uniref:TRAP transporter substrate-binding protein n=1 Tax=Anaerotruncus TaxID=244127 RepID=UPI000E4BEDFF|nr:MULTISPECIES: TRAP transporter substrate-binding protein [Anaerotruncus]RGX54731.1 hypothetical protein DWV16_12445 [Anaerotruncus sp. AF02-27]
MKKLLTIALCFTMVLFLFAGCSGSAPSAAPAASSGTPAAPAASAAPADGTVLALKAAHVVSEESSTHKTLVRLGEEIEKVSGGKMTVEVYGNSVMGTAREIVESMQAGALDMAILANAPYSGFTDALTCFDVPYLFDSLDEGWYVLDDPFGTEILSDLENQGLHCLGWVGASWRNMSTTKVEAHSPADMKGLKMRVIESPMHVEHFNLIGCSATPMAFSELYTALQQGVVDGQDNHWLEMWTSALHEVQGYLMETRHIMDPTNIMMSKTTYDNLTDEQRGWVDEAFESAKADMRQITTDDELTNKQNVIDAGHCKVIELTEAERDSFKAAAQPMIDKYTESNPNVKKIITLTEEFRAQNS